MLTITLEGKTTELDNYTIWSPASQKDTVEFFLGVDGDIERIKIAMTKELAAEIGKSLMAHCSRVEREPVAPT